MERDPDGASVEASSLAGAMLKVDDFGLLSSRAAWIKGGETSGGPDR
jgi:hypothetical protein